MQNKKENKRPANKSASNARKPKQLKGRTKPKMALPPAESIKAPIARLMEAASRAALPGVITPAEEASKPTKKTAGAKGKGANGKAPTNGRAKSNGKTSAKKGAKTSAGAKAATAKVSANGEAKVDGGKTSTAAKKNANGKASAAAKKNANGKASAAAKKNGNSKKAVASGKATGKAVKDEVVVNNKKTTPNDKVPANAAGAKEKTSTNKAVAATEEVAKEATTEEKTSSKAQAPVEAKADPKENPKADAKAKDIAKAKPNTDVEEKANSEKKADAKTKTKDDSKADSKEKTKADANAKADAKAKAKPDSNAKAKAKAKANAEEKAKVDLEQTADAKQNAEPEQKDGIKAKGASLLAKIKGSSSNPKKAYVPAHQAPEPPNVLEKIKALPTTTRTKAILAKDWVIDNARTPKFIAIVSAIAAVIVVYIVCSLVFSAVYMPGTTINGNDISLSTPAAMTSKAEETSNNYKLAVSGDGTDFSILGSDVGLSFDADTYRADAASHLFGWAWPVGIFVPKDFAVNDGVSFDDGKVKSTVDAKVKAVNENATLPQNATISYDSNKGTFVAKDEKGGTAISEDAALEAISLGIHELKDHVELGDAELQQPSVTASSDKMNDAISKANSLSKTELPLTVNGKTAATVDGKLIGTWLKIDDSYNIKADLDLVTDWAQNDLSSEVDTAGTARTYTRTNDGKRIEVYGGGTYGWNMDGAKLAEAVCDRIANGSSEPLEIPMKTKGEVYIHGKQDWGPRYVDVDLSEQYVRMFDENSNIVMESSCVSGNISENNDTVTGVFSLEDKESPMLLVGLDENGDGQPDYENEVQYWMPFYGGYGLHDALWRSYFGEDVYQYDGSHGCINLPYYAAEQLYGLIRVGDTVVVHF